MTRRRVDLRRPLTQRSNKGQTALRCSVKDRPVDQGTRQSHIGGMATNTTTAAPERLWSIEDLADFLVVPVNTIYRWRKYGEGPRSFKVGRHIRFRPADVTDWLEAQAQAPTQKVEPSHRPAARGSIKDDEAFWAN